MVAAGRASGVKMGDVGGGSLFPYTMTSRRRSFSGTGSPG